MPKLDYRTGILSGSLEGLTGVVQKKRSFVRKRVMPADPQTPDQLHMRSAVQEVNSLGRQIYDPILKPLTAPKPKKSTIYNRFMQVNKAMLSGGAIAPFLVKLCDGDLYFPLGWNFYGDVPWELVHVAWTVGLQGEANANDRVILLCIDSDSRQVRYNISEVRSAGVGTIDIAGVPHFNTLWCWIAFVSNTQMSKSETKVDFYA